MIFDINDYDHTYVMHCKTSEEANAFCKYLDDNGYRWFGGDSYVGRTRWSADRGGTCYRFKAGVFDSLAVYLSPKAESAFGFSPVVLEFADFEWGSHNNLNISFEDVMGYQ